MLIHINNLYCIDFFQMFLQDIIIESPRFPIYLPISQNHNENIQVWITDQDSNEINVLGETLNIGLIIKSS